jgi:Family of unknown function (DUF5906)
MSKARTAISLDEFVAYLPAHTYIFLPTREPWPGESVNSQFPGGVALLDENGKPVLSKKGKNKGEPVMISTSAWLDINRPVHQMTWAPGQPLLIKDKVVADGGWVDHPGAVCLNLYRPPTLKPKRGRVKPWLDHIKRIYPDDAGHIIKYLAHRVQHPFDKINHALMLGGAQGIGKDTLLEPVKYAVGPWNFAEVSPIQMMGRFNGFLKSVVLRVSEARDLGESNRFAAYDHTKTYTAAPPHTLRVDEKHLREHYVFNCCGVIITTNHKTDGVYLPADDRRHYVAWSDCTKEDFSPAYWKKLWSWYRKGGIEAVAAYLASLDISSFDAKAPPPQTEAFWAIVDANRAPEEAELADVFERLGNPDAVTLTDVITQADTELRDWLDDKKNRRVIPHRLETAGYVRVRNAAAGSGLWTIDRLRRCFDPVTKKSSYEIEGVRQAIYAKASLSVRDQFVAVQALRQKVTAKVKATMAEDANGPKKKPNGSGKGVFFRD